MRRIYKQDSVTTSDDFFLLEDLLLTNSGSDAEGDLFEDGQAGLDEIQRSDIPAADSVDGYIAKPVQQRGLRPTVQEVAHLQELRDQIIAQATAESARLIEEGCARAQAEYEAALSRAAQEIENTRQEAYALGRKEAFEQHSKAITDCVANLEASVARLEGMQAGFITGYESDLKWMALEIAQKILMDTIVADETRLIPLVMHAVNSAKNAPWISVEISENMTRLLTHLQHALESQPFVGKVNLKLVSAPADTCMVETPDSCFDASIIRQIENLKGYFAAERE